MRVCGGTAAITDLEPSGFETLLWTVNVIVCIIGELFAQCPLDGYPSAAMEQVVDSSRYFVIRIQDDLGWLVFF